tara:strand:- start:317 stop:574 length:258 start_codon:yes stop_codon:yes gene_type:complete
VFNLLTENDDSENDQVGGMSTSPRISKMMSFEWLGQTLASMCWIISVFVYETDVNLWSNGDWLQLAAASSWMVSNIASVVNLKVD